jgi:PIN domain nuclease of toxin-antitoxin system
MLLDTHVLLWYVLGDRERISRPLQKRIESGPSIASVASLWEVAIKSALGKLEAPDDLPALVESLGFEVLEVTSRHAWAVRELPHHHRDLFDRLLIAQARVERLPILTADPAFADYDVDVTWES